jgi:hypothetical protein
MNALDDAVREAEESAMALINGLSEAASSSFEDVAMLAFAYHAAATVILHNAEFPAADRTRLIEVISAIEPRARAVAEKWLRESDRWRGDDT